MPDFQSFFGRTSSFATENAAQPPDESISDLGCRIIARAMELCDHKHLKNQTEAPRDGQTEAAPRAAQRNDQDRAALQAAIDGLLGESSQVS